MNRILRAVFLLVATSALSLSQTLIRVPQDQPTIRAGINAASNGDTVLVAEGTYVENITISKRIIVGSLFLQDGDTSHISKTIIDGSQPSYVDSGSVVVFIAGSDSTSLLSGFTLTKGLGTRVFEVATSIIWVAGGGVMVLEGGATIRNNIIRGNSVTASFGYGYGGGIANLSLSANVVIESNTISSNNVTGGSWAAGGGMSIGCKLYVANNIIAHNSVIGSGFGGGVELWGAIGTRIVFLNNTVALNTASDGIEGMAISTTHQARIMNNIIWNPGDGVDVAFDLPEDFIHAKNNLVRGNFVGTNNLNCDPGFADTVTFTLSPTSPCISAGSDSAVLNGVQVSAPATDRYGSARPQAAGTYPDLGAVESSTGTASPVTQEPQLSYHTIVSSSFERDYFVFLPRNYASLTNLRLLISLHGCGGAGAEFMRWASPREIADSMDFVVVYPTSITPCWEDGLNGKGNRDVVFIDDLIDTMVAQYKIDDKRIYLTGWSSGGFLTYRLAAESRHQIAGIAPFGATMPDGLPNPSPPRPIPLIYFEGTSDNNVKYEGGTGYLSAPQTLELWRSYNHCDSVSAVELPDVNGSDFSTVTRILYQPGPGISRGASIHFYRVNGGGHVLPGPQPWWNAPTNRDINGPLEIMKFFSQSDRYTDVKEEKDVGLLAFGLSQNYPNPFNPRTALSYQLSAFSRVTLNVYDILGREVATLVSGEQPAGVYTAEWNASVSSGVYFYRLEARERDGRIFVETRKMMFMK